MTNLKPMHCPQCGKYPVTWVSAVAWHCCCADKAHNYAVLGSGDTKKQAVKAYNTLAKKRAKLLAREAKKAAKKRK